MRLAREALPFEALRLEVLPLEARAPIHAWIAIALARELEPREYARLRQEPLRGLLARLEPSLGIEQERASQPSAEAEEDALRAEYARLFLVPGGVSPRVSAWLEGDQERIASDLATLVARGYEAIGRAPRSSEPWGRLPLDHAALVFDLMAHAAGSDSAADREVARHLDETLLAGWPPAFGEALAARATHPIYRALGRLIAALHAPRLHQPT